MPVPGLLGGAVGGPEPPILLPLLTLLLMPGGARPESLIDEDGGAPASDTARCVGGGILGVDVGPGAGGPLAVRGGPALGGGGVEADLASVFSAPAFLLIQRFSSGS
jgi:hypothetical protein